MIEEARGRIDYAVCGTGPTVVLVPGSCSTGAAWRPVIASWNGQFRCVTTSLLGYGGTVERRTASDPDISHEAEMLETVVREAGSRVHLAGHSFGGLVALAVALRNRVPLASLVVLEAPGPELLRDRGEHQHYRAFRRMTDAYFAAFERGNAEAIAAMIDFYGGAGTYASWPLRARAYAVDTTPVNILDWASAYGFPLSPASLSVVRVPALVIRGGASHPAVQRANALLRECMSEAILATIETAAHFMIATHPSEAGRLIAQHVHSAEAGLNSEPFQSTNCHGWRNFAVGASCKSGFHPSRPFAAVVAKGSFVYQGPFRSSGDIGRGRRYRTLNAGIARLADLEQRGIVAGTTSADSAPIGDSRALYRDGILPHVNGAATRLGGRVGMPLKQFVDLLIAASNRRTPEPPNH